MKNESQTFAFFKQLIFNVWLQKVENKEAKNDI